MTTIERRSEGRIECNIEAHYESPTLSLNVVVKNMSSGGCFIHTPYLDIVGTSATLFIKLNNQPTSIAIPAKVVYTRDDSINSAGMGIKFLPQSAEDILKVTEVLRILKKVT